MLLAFAFLFFVIYWSIFVVAPPTNSKLKIDEIEGPSSSSYSQQWPNQDGVKPWPIPLDSCGIIGDEEMQNLLAESQSEIQLDCNENSKGNDKMEGKKGDEDEENPRILLDLGMCHFSGHSYHIVMEAMRICRLDKALIWFGNKCANICNKFGFPRCAAFIKNEVKWWAENGGKMGESPIFYALPGEHGGEKYPATAHVKKMYKVTRQLSGKLCQKIKKNLRGKFSGEQQEHLLPKTA